MRRNLPPERFISTRWLGTAAMLRVVVLPWLRAGWAQSVTNLEASRVLHDRGLPLLYLVVS